VVKWDAVRSLQACCGVRGRVDRWHGPVPWCRGDRCARDATCLTPHPCICTQLWRVCAVCCVLAGGVRERAATCICAIWELRHAHSWRTWRATGASVPRRVDSARRQWGAPVRGCREGENEHTGRGVRACAAPAACTMYEWHTGVLQGWSTRVTAVRLHTQQWLVHGRSRSTDESGVTGARRLLRARSLGLGNSCISICFNGPPAPARRSRAGPGVADVRRL